MNEYGGEDGGPQRGLCVHRMSGAQISSLDRLASSLTANWQQHIGSDTSFKLW